MFLTRACSLASWLQPGVSQNGLPSTSSSRRPAASRWTRRCSSISLPSNENSPTKPEQRIDNIAEPFFAGGQLGGGL